MNITLNIVRTVNNLCRRLEREHISIEGVAVMDNLGNIVVEKRWKPDYPRDIYSNTKSFTSAAVGIAISRGQLALDDKPLDFFRDHRKTSYSSLHEQMTLEDLLTMSSGYAEANLMYFERRAGVGASNYLEYMMNQQVIVKPGSRYLYSTGDAILAGLMVERAVGCSLHSYLYNELFRKIGICYPIWENDLVGHTCGGSGLQLKLTDMMMLGVLYLNKGKHLKERFFDAHWGDVSTHGKFDVQSKDDNWSGFYGYLWKIFPDHKGFRASGVFGQETIIIPSEGIVIGMQCMEGTKFQRIQTLVNEEIFDQLFI